MEDKVNANKYLIQAVQRGFNNFDLLTQETDFGILSNTPEWYEAFDTDKTNNDYLLNTTNVSLYQMFRRDQAERSGQSVDWDISPDESDEDRLKKVKEIVNNGGLFSAYDFYFAAIIMQHGKDSDDYRIANVLSIKAKGLDPNNHEIKWLVCASEDRYLHSIGRAQVWGTQYLGGPGNWTLEPFDTTIITDNERVECGVRTIKEAKLRVGRMNSQ